MNKQIYIENRASYLNSLKKYKERCQNCWQPDDTCVCSQLKPFDPNISFVILTHPIEAKKRIASGRLAFTCLKNSYFIRGYDFIKHPTVNKLIESEEHQCFVLYPGLQAHWLCKSSFEQKKSQFKSNKRTVIFVIDGTWGNANKMLRLSPNLATLPKICFSPKGKSNFKVRKQPKDFCLSTLEAVHEVIELLGPTRNFDLAHGKHKNLLHVFKYIVDDQLVKIEKYKLINGGLNYRSSRSK